MKQNEDIRPLDGFRSTLYFKNDFPWNEFKPKFVNSTGSEDGIYLEFIGKIGNKTIPNPDLIFSVPEFKLFWGHGKSIIKEIGADLELRLCKKDVNGKTFPISGSIVGDFIIEIGFELNLN